MKASNRSRLEEIAEALDEAIDEIGEAGSPVTAGENIIFLAIQLRSALRDVHDPLVRETLREAVNDYLNGVNGSGTRLEELCMPERSH